ncbi:MAG: hypothetical protein IIY78_02270 [Clostridia bacterium]|nr:hypothetical protein [Clostridia bacterium]
MSEIFKIIKIDEADFGCEGVPEGQPIRDSVVIENESHNEFIMQIEDSLLYEKDLNEGDRFTVDENGNIVKVTN